MAGITLAQLAQVSKDPLTKFVALKILRDSPVMKTLPFENISSLTVQAQWWEQLPTGGAFRSLNEGYSSYEDGQLGEGQEALFGFGGDITFDRILEQITNVVRDPIQVQQEGKLKSMALQWNDYFINGDPASDPKGFSGLKKRVAALPTRQMVYAAASSSAGLDVTASAANVIHFFNDLEAAWHYCNGGDVSMIITNEAMILGLGRACRYAQTQGNLLDVTKDTLGRDFYTWRGKPLFDMGTKKDMSTEIITVTETGGSGSANTTSMYFVSCNMDDGLYGIQLNPLNVYDPLAGGEMESKPSKLRRVDWWNGLANFGRYGIVRFRNILDPASWTA